MPHVGIPAGLMRGAAERSGILLRSAPSGRVAPRSPPPLNSDLSADRYLEDTRVLGVVVQGDVGGPRFLPGLGRDDPARIVVLFQLDRVGRAEQQAETASLRHAPGEKWKRRELVAVDLAGPDQLLLSQRSAVAGAEHLLRQQHAR